MSVKSISYNGFSLQDANVRTKDIIYRNVPSKILDLQPRARRDGFRLVNSYYSTKDILVNGAITEESESLLKTKVDALKKALNTDEANLDIDDGGTSMRWVCSVESMNVPEEHYHITRIPYSIIFRCQPYAHSTASTVDTASVSGSSFTSSVVIQGSGSPSPIIRWTVNGTPTEDVTAISFANNTTGDTITVSSLTLDANNDYLEIDTDAMTCSVSYDGSTASSVDFTGVFPSFDASTNSYTVTVTCAGSFALDQSITYYAAYL
jgi:predicted phage tail component-like protein